MAEIEVMTRVERRRNWSDGERAALAPLPDTDHEFAEWGFARVYQSKTG